MGSFARMVGAKIGDLAPDEQKTLQDRMETVFKAGGMLSFDQVQLAGRPWLTLDLPEPDADGLIDVVGNFFERDLWENAGWGGPGRARVYSSKLGSGAFADTVLAAYALESQYTDGPTAIMYNNELVLDARIVGWLNYLFPDACFPAQTDPARAVKVLWSAEGGTWPETQELLRAMRLVTYTTGGLISMNALWTMGGAEPDTPIRVRTPGDGPDLDYRAAQDALRSTLKTFRSTSGLPEAEQVQQLTGLLAQAQTGAQDGTDLRDAGERAQIRELMYTLDTPACSAAEIANVYGLSFWDVWDALPEKAREGTGRVTAPSSRPAHPVSTDDFFGCIGDDRTLYWQKDGDVEFSPSMWAWLKGLQDEHKILVAQPVPEQEQLERRLVRLVKELEAKYGLYVMHEPLVRMLASTDNRRLWALWRMFEQRVLAQTEDTAAECRDAFRKNYPDGLPYIFWRVMSQQQKELAYAKMLLVRFLGVMANEELRWKLFLI